MSTADRLNAAMKLRGRSTRSFQRAMADRKVPGSSTAAVYRYLSGEAEPSVVFLKAAADVLGVNPVWLVLEGEGGPIGIEDPMPAALRSDSYIWDWTEEPLRAAFPPHAQLLPFVGAAPVSLISEIALGRAYAPGIIEVPTDEEHEAIMRQTATEVGEVLSLALARFRPEGPEEKALADYVILMCQAIRRLLPTKHERDDARRAEFVSRTAAITDDPEKLRRAGAMFD